MASLSMKLYEQEIRTLLSLPDDERGKILTALLLSVLGEEPQELNPMENAVYELVKAQVERANALSVKRSHSGGLGGAPTGNSNAVSRQANSTKNKQTSPSGQANSTTNTITNTNTSTDTNTDHDAPTARAVTALEQRFNEFWEAYPKKTAKKTAFKAWEKAKPTAELHAKILTSIEAAKRSDQWRREGGQYIPNPATWINGGCWDDEIMPQNGKVNTMDVLSGIIAKGTGLTTTTGFNPARVAGFHSALDGIVLDEDDLDEEVQV